MNVYAKVFKRLKEDGNVDEVFRTIYQKVTDTISGKSPELSGVNDLQKVYDDIKRRNTESRNIESPDCMDLNRFIGTRFQEGYRFNHYTVEVSEYNLIIEYFKVVGNAEEKNYDPLDSISYKQRRRPVMPTETYISQYIRIEEEYVPGKINWFTHCVIIDTRDILENQDDDQTRQDGLAFDIMKITLDIIAYTNGVSIWDTRNFNEGYDDSSTAINDYPGMYYEFKDFLCEYIPCEHFDITHCKFGCVDVSDPYYPSRYRRRIYPHNKDFLVGVQSYYNDIKKEGC